MTRTTDVIGGFPLAAAECAGCGKPLTLENAWMTDGCPCNSYLGVNSMNETRWRLLMRLQQDQSYAGEELARQLENTKSQYFVGSATRISADKALSAWRQATRSVALAPATETGETK